MGIIERILEFLFGKKKPEHGQAQASLEDSVKMVSAELAGNERQLVQFSSAKFSEIKHLVLRLSKGAELLEKQKIDLKEGNEGFRRIVTTSQKNLSRQLRGLSQKLFPPQSVTAQSVREYCARALPAIANDLMPYWKNVALTKLLLKEEIKDLGENLKELASVISQLHAKAFDPRMAKLSNMDGLGKKIAEKAGAIGALGPKIAQEKKALEVLQADALSAEAAISEKAHSAQALGLKELEARISLLESRKAEIVSRLNSSLAPLEKVLKRLHSVAESGDALSVREKEVLALLLGKPESAIISDPKGETTKAIFSKAAEMIESGSISLKDSEKEKRLEALRALIAKDFFSEFFWEMNKCQAELSQCQKEASSLTISSELRALEAKLASGKAAVESKRHELDSQEKEFAKLRAEEKQLYAEFTSLFSPVFGGGREMKGG